MHDSSLAPDQPAAFQGSMSKALILTIAVSLLITTILIYLLDHWNRRHVWVRRRMERFCDSQCDEWPSKVPLGRGDAFSFLFHDLLTMSKESKKRLLDVLCAAELEQESFHAGLYPDEWLEFLPWRIVRALHPAASMSLSRLPATDGDDRGPEIIYGNEAWLQSPPRDQTLPNLLNYLPSVTTPGVTHHSRRVEIDVHLDNVLIRRKKPLIRKMRAAHRVPEDLSMSWTFLFAIRWAWTDNPYLVDFQTRYEVPIWGVPVPKRLLVAGTDAGAGPRRRVFKPHFGFVEFWAGAFQVSVDPAAGAVRVELDEDLDVPAPDNLEKVINGFRMLHTALLYNLMDAFDDKRDAGGPSLEEVVQRTFHDAVTSERSDERDMELQKHWRALAMWRPTVHIIYKSAA